MTKIEEILSNKGLDIRPRYLKPSREQLMRLQASSEPMTMYRFHSIVSGRKPMWLEEAVKIANWLEVELEEIVPDYDLPHGH